MYKKQIKGIIFDLDGTLVSSDIDFLMLKKNIGCPNDQDILAYIESLDEPEEQQAASNLVMQIELEDALSCEWIPGAQAFLQTLLSNNIPMAIVTRNCRVATSIKVSNHNIPIKLVLTREDAICKPDPAALNIIAQQWGFAASEIAYVGDYIYDIEAANRAQMQAWAYQYQVQQPSDLQVDMHFNCYTELDIKQLNIYAPESYLPES
jgi:HAD superfamily hydrolase (TIGR01509 family)